MTARQYVSGETYYIWGKQLFLEFKPSQKRSFKIDGNKIILEMVVKDLEEIKFLVESLSLPEKIDPLLIEITATKAKAFYQELMFLSANNPILVEKEEILIEEQPLISPENNTADEEEIPVEEISSEELSEVETPVAEEVSAPVDEIGSAAGKTVSEQDTSEEIKEYFSVN